MADIPINPVAAIVALLTVLLGPEVAVYLGPYVVIAAAGLTGASFSLGRRDPEAKLGATLFLVVMVGFSLLLTVAITRLVGMVWAPLGSDWMLAPVALVIGFIGDDWTAVFRWVGGLFGRRIERRIGGGGE